MGLKSGEYGGRYSSRRRGGFKSFPDSPDFVRGQIVQNHHLARAQGGPESLCHPSQKHFAVHGAFKKAKERRTLQTNAGDQVLV